MGTNTNNRFSVTHVLFRKGEGCQRGVASVQAVGWGPERPVVTILTSPTAAEGIVNETALLISVCNSRGRDREQRQGKEPATAGQDKGLFS